MSGWNLFKHHDLLNQEDEEWHLQTWSWMLKHLGGIDRLRKSPVVAPTNDFFPPIKEEGEKLARYIFDCVRKHAAMETLSCELVPQRPDALIVGELASGRPIYSGKSGSFREDRDGIVITYDPSEIAEPLALVSTFTHEIAHYLVAHAGEAPPGGSEMVEYATDLVTVFLGFGIFGADCAFNFWQGPGGGRTGGPWGYSTRGYLREVDWAYALAVFLRLRGADIGAVEKWLKPTVADELKEALRDIALNPSKVSELQRMSVSGGLFTSTQNS